MPNGNVLVVEDDDTIRQLLMEYLKQHSLLTVDGARDGVEALHQISTKRYSVVVLDLMMPKMSGVDLLDSINALISDPSVKSIDRPPRVIVITAASDLEVPSSAITSRSELVRDVLRKPVDVAGLGDAVERALTRA